MEPHLPRVGRAKERCDVTARQHCFKSALSPRLDVKLKEGGGGWKCVCGGGCWTRPTGSAPNARTCLESGGAARSSGDSCSDQGNYGDGGLSHTGGFTSAQAPQSELHSRMEEFCPI
uniref:Uncharacterized protein n=1 Tax=Knipowitschia caucasica TaxID=637954 RepID=A0AAV2LAT1_KNICA